MLGQSFGPRWVWLRLRPRLVEKGTSRTERTRFEGFCRATQKDVGKGAAFQQYFVFMDVGQTYPSRRLET